MKSIVEFAIKQPISVAVGVILIIIAGLLTLNTVSIRMSPEVDSVVISVSTGWQSASPEQIESDIIEEQEAQLGELKGLVSMTSISSAGLGEIRLEFETGTDIDSALAEVTRKLNEVPNYPSAAVSQPEVKGIDPDSVDYIAWIGLASTDPDFDASTLYDFMDRRMKPIFERLEGISEVGVIGSREAEVLVKVDPVELAQRGLNWANLVDAIQLSNGNFSGGLLPEGKNNYKLRAVGRFYDAESVKGLVIRRDESGPVYLGDIADVELSYKESTGWVRARGQKMSFFNFQLQSGANVIDTMELIKDQVAEFNKPGGALEQYAKSRNMNGTLELVQVYDATVYVKEAVVLVRDNILLGGVLAIITLLLFLRSLRTIGIIAIAIPISIIGTIVAMIALGRSINIVSLAGMAFAVGMVVDNSIVVIENIFRHMEMRKSVARAALDGTKEVADAVLASSLTTVVVFLPILLIKEDAGQLFQDIAYAIMSAVVLSFVVAITVIPTLASRYLKAPKKKDDTAKSKSNSTSWNPLVQIPNLVYHAVYAITGSWLLRIGVVVFFITITVIGIKVLTPPLDYLPRGNRNIVFGIMVPPPGYNLDKMAVIGDRLEETLRPYWEATENKFQVETILEGGTPTVKDERKSIQTVDSEGEPLEVTPPPLNNYFMATFGGILFHGAISEDPRLVTDVVTLMNEAANPTVAPDVFGFAFQPSVFRTGGQTGSAIKIDLMGENQDNINRAAMALFGSLFGEYGPGSVTPEPNNFMLPAPEIRATPKDERLRELGLTRRDVGLAMQANGDGILLVRQYEVGGELKDIKLITPGALSADPLQALRESPIATNEGYIVDLESVANVDYVRSPDKIKHVDRRRAVTLEFTPPVDLPLEDAIGIINDRVSDFRADGTFSPDVDVQLAGSAGKLAILQRILMGDGTFIGTITSSLFLALTVVYLLMVVLFQNWLYPLVIMITVPLAVLGGFVGLSIVHEWSSTHRYLPVQNMDVLTILGFVILAGTVVNNAILIVYQTLGFVSGNAEDSDVDFNPDTITVREAIAMGVKSRVRPILMSIMTSVLGMLPLVILPGSGSELYRGLGAVIVGGMIVSTVFTLFLIPTVLSMMIFKTDREKALEGNTTLKELNTQESNL